MKEKIIICLLPLSIFVFGQSINLQLTSSNGHFFETTGAELSGSLGEPAGVSYSNSSAVLNQGFQQPVLQSISLDEEIIKMNLSVYPNPTTHWVNVEGLVEGDNNAFKILDADGKMLWEEELILNGQSIDFSNLPAGNYLLGIEFPQFQKTVFYKIQKIN